MFEMRNESRVITRECYFSAWDTIWDYLWSSHSTVTCTELSNLYIIPYFLCHMHMTFYGYLIL